MMRGIVTLAWFVCPVFVWVCLLPCGCSDKPGSGSKLTPAAAVPDKTFRVLTIISYNSGLPCTDLQIEGFKEAMRGLKVEYKQFEMDTKRKSSKEAKSAAGKEACGLIESWKPDLVYAADDSAQEYVTTKYLNTSLPFVFSGVNEDAEKYGFEKASNVTGCLEREHFTATIRLLQQVAPNVKKIGVLLDEEPFWNTVAERMKKEVAEIPDVQFVSWERPKTFLEFQALMRRFEKEVDAVAVIGVFSFKDENGQNVDYRVVQRWIAENLKVPDCSFWYDRVTNGTLCSMTVAARQQGMVAGEMARQILIEGKRPGDIPMRPTYKGEPCISLPRARMLGLNPNSSVLLNSRVLQEYDWGK